MATRGVRDADVSFNDILSRLQILRNFIHEALDGRAGAGDTGALRRVSEQHFFGVVGISAHGECACRLTWCL